MKSINKPRKCGWGSQSYPWIDNLMQSLQCARQTVRLGSICRHAYEISFEFTLLFFKHATVSQYSDILIHSNVFRLVCRWYFRSSVISLQHYRSTRQLRWCSWRLSQGCDISSRFEADSRTSSNIYRLECISQIRNPNRGTSCSNKGTHRKLLERCAEVWTKPRVECERGTSSTRSTQTTMACLCFEKGPHTEEEDWRTYEDSGYLVTKADPVSHRHNSFLQTWCWQC